LLSSLERGMPMAPNGQTPEVAILQCTAWYLSPTPQQRNIHPQMSVC
jgi:hypothetical protein